MKKIKLLIISTLLLSFSSCDSYLDRQPDDPMTAENIFLKYETTLKYLINVYSWIPNESDISGQTHLMSGSADEVSIAYSGRFFGTYNRNMLSPAYGTAPYRTYTYDDMYKGIREATYFMQHIKEVPSSELSEEEKKIWHAEARFLRAYYYFMLMRYYGPVILLEDEIVDFTGSTLADRDRSPWDECINWVTSELDAAATDLPVAQLSTQWWGRATRGAAMAVKARLLLYSARPLFNGNPLYSGMNNKNGVSLFSTTSDAKKWEVAAEASKKIIELQQYSLVDDPTKTALVNIRNVYLLRNNSELIFSRETGGYESRVTATPANIGGTSYGGVGPTQKLIDAFAMDNGKYPIKGYLDDGATPIIDPQSDYSETGFSNFTNPLFNKTVNTFKMYQNREPRFYANVFWSGQTWVGGTFSKADIQFYAGGNAGPLTSNNYPPTGYLAIKFIDPTKNSVNGEWGTLSYPLFRYGEVLLNYIEALNEYDPTNSDILTYWNQIRKRAGVPLIEDVYPDVVGNKELQREYIRRERQLELCFENLRYFDTRTWMISDQADNGAVYGMNIYHTNHTADGPFWKRTIVKTEGGYPGIRIWQNKKYLLPIHQAELDRVNITQNYGW
ncbi:RagB/SusD family nutrient uptake outer membrane protein [Sphingobacterium faecale]|uniref:RagB/SusD family nutrient uptake outer membrane protein n=1 Tax=Sphingobacterium faecale TaxID=2803775 RepID=A0ABS1R3G1_9SPHI|nr:RagB/SusD family nutrient uptake outer membrane protein [Sphingobacterium faecale]MBL1409249.1 RagB/SusD family nutrient uptake outer membrane protein [Sphingobacterium faecale]